MILENCWQRRMRTCQKPTNVMYVPAHIYIKAHTSQVAWVTWEKFSRRFKSWNLSSIQNFVPHTHLHTYIYVHIDTYLFIYTHIYIFNFFVSIPANVARLTVNYIHNLQSILFNKRKFNCNYKRIFSWHISNVFIHQFANINILFNTIRIYTYIYSLF